MIKYSIQTLKGATSIIEVELRQVSLLEDPSLAWRINAPECMYYIVKPSSFPGEAFMSWAFFDSRECALAKAQADILHEAKRTAEKSHSNFDNERYQERLSAIKFVNL